MMDRHKNPIIVRWLGTMPYEEAWEYQAKLAQEVAERGSLGQLLLLEHPPTYTFGRKGHAEHLLMDEAERERQGIALHWVDRGGDVTYHGPGQLVGYPILALAQLQQRESADLHLYLRQLEQSLIDTLAQFGLHSWRYSGYTGVWVDQVASETPHAMPSPHKIAAIGVKVTGKGVTMHGFALNVAPNLAHFRGIIPCGITEHPVTSLAQQLGKQYTSAELIPAYLRAFSNCFGVTTEW